MFQIISIFNAKTYFQFHLFIIPESKNNWTVLRICDSMRNFFEHQNKKTNKKKNG